MNIETTSKTPTDEINSSMIIPDIHERNATQPLANIHTTQTLLISCGARATMSMRILFSKARTVASGDAPEKAKSKTKNMFRLAEGQPLQTDGRQQTLCIQPGDEDEEDESVIEIDVQCCCKFALLIVSLLCFGGSVFACGAVYASSQNSEPPHFETSATHNPAPAPALRRIPSSNATSATSATSATPETPETLATLETPNTGTGTVEYIQLSFQLTQSRDGALGTLDQCVRLMLQSTAFQVEEMLLESYSLLIRPVPKDGVGDRMLEYLNGGETRAKLEACSKVSVDSEPIFVYR